MPLSLLYGFATLLTGCLLGYYSVEPIAVVVLTVATLHVLPFLVQERTSKDLALVGAAGVVHALVFASLSYTIGWAIAFVLHA
jgi:hypothetical protein